MRYVVIINLDYQNHEAGELRALYADICTEMQERGFSMHGRQFTIDVPAEEAQHLARYVIDVLDRRYSAKGSSVYGYIKEFFGFEAEHSDNLLLPPDDDIEVSELEGLEGLHLVDLLRQS